MDFENYLRSLILNSIKVDENKFQIIFKTLKDIGVENKDHVNYVKVEDLQNVLTKIQARILVEKFQCSETTATATSATASTSATAATNGNVNSPQFLDSEIPKSLNINWTRLSSQVLRKLEKNIIPAPSERREMVRVIADEILSYTTNPSKKLVYVVARNCVQKFAILQDRIDDVKAGSGFESFAYQLYTRLENLKRKKNVSNSLQKDTNCRKRKNTVIDSYGCVLWSPPMPDEETMESLQNKKKLLKEKKVGCTKSLLKETYYLLRQDINNSVKMEDLQTEWPAFFTEVALFDHFNMLTSVNVMEELEKRVLSKGKEIISFLSSCKKGAARKFIYESQEDGSNELLIILLGTAHYFGEDLSSFIILSDILDLDEISNTMPCNPILIGKGTSYLHCEEYALIIDRIVVISCIKELAVSIGLLFSAYFIFNIKYPKELQLTLEFFQRCLVGINPLSGSKTLPGKRSNGVHPKVFNYINKIKSCQSWLADARF